MNAPDRSKRAFTRTFRVSVTPLNLWPLTQFPFWVVPATCDNPEDDNAPDKDATGHSRILNGASSTSHCSGHDTKEDSSDGGQHSPGLACLSKFPAEEPLEKHFAELICLLSVPLLTIDIMFAA